MKTGRVTYKIAVMGLFIALSYIGTRINFPVLVGGAKTMFHLGNSFCLLAALLLGGAWGGFSGAVGMTFFDLTSGYQYYAPQTFVLKFIIGLICGILFRNLPIKNESVRVVVSCSAAMLFNVIFDPIASFFTSKYILGAPKELSSLLAKWSMATTFVNAVIAVIIAAVLYKALKTALIKKGV